MVAFIAKDEAPAVAAEPATSPRFGDVQREFVDTSGVRYRYRFNMFASIAVAIGTGFLASMFGIGGGVVQVPAMIYLFSFPTHIAMATSQITIAITALFGSISHAYYGDILPLPALYLAIGAIGGAQLGARLASHMRTVALTRWFSLAVVVAALYLIFRG